MGNCLKGSTADDISLLRGSDGTRDSSSSDQLGPPPPYQPASRLPPTIVTVGLPLPVSLWPTQHSGLQVQHLDTRACQSEFAEACIRESMPVYYPSPNVSRPAAQLTEEEQVKIAKRIGLIQHLPTGTYDGCKKNRECVICMIEFMIGDAVRYLPCMHTYHVECIDDWLMRSFTCPSCMEPVDAALLTSYETN